MWHGILSKRNIWNYDSVLIVKNHGFKELLKRKGGKFLRVISSYYLFRDLAIHVVIPLLITRGIIQEECRFDFM